MSPNEALLKKSFSDIADSLSMTLANTDTSARAAVLKKNSPHLWLSMNIGAPLGKTHRVFFMGFNLERAFPHENTMESADVSLIIGPSHPSQMETYLKWQNTTIFPQIPTCILDAPETSFYQRAFVSWGQRHFPVLSHASSIENFVDQKLEWALSF
jgi:hypothetical protein